MNPQGLSHIILVLLFRIRRVKCDERVPHCLRCESSGRVCDGYLDESSNFISRRQLADRLKNVSVVGPASRVLVRNAPPSMLPPAMSAQEYIYFDLFRAVTAMDTDSAFIPSGFWSRDLLQLAHNEPAVWHATLALGALHQRWGEIEPAVAAEKKDMLLLSATRHYGKAMALAANVDRPEVLLALSLALVAAANMFGFWREAHAHMLAGMKLLEKGNHISSRRSLMDMNCITSTLIRMDLQSMTFSDSSSPYPFDKASSLEDLAGRRAAPAHPDQQPLESYSQAATVLFALIRQLVLTDRAFSTGLIEPAAHNTARFNIIQNIMHFEEQMAQFETQQHQPPKNTTTAFIYIRIYHAWLRLLSKIPFYSSQMEYDNYLGHFERIIVLCHVFLRRQKDTGDRRMLLSLEPAVIVPLFDTVKRCRHPQLRRLALKLLNSMSRHEGMWRSDGAAAAAQVLIMVEEGVSKEELLGSLDGLEVTEAQEKAALYSPWNAWSVSSNYEPPCGCAWTGSETVWEHDRIGEVMILSSFEEHRFQLRLVMSTGDPAQPYGDVKDITLTIGEEV